MKNSFKKKLSLFLVLFLIISQPFGNTAYVSASPSIVAQSDTKALCTLAGAGTTESPYQISSATDFPKSIPEGTVYTLTADLVLNSGQWIETLSGTLDGQGHTITLADQPLANSVSGTIQNLGVTSSDAITGTDTFGSMAVTLTGIIQNCYSTASVNISGWSDIGGIAGTLNGGIIRNSYYAGNSSAMCVGGLAGINNSTSSILSNCFYTAGTGDAAVSMLYSQPQKTNCGKKTVAELKTASTAELLNTDISETGFYWTVSEDDYNNGFPVLTAGKYDAAAAAKTALDTEIKKANALDETVYTSESWSVLQAALSKAEATLEKDNSTKEDISSALNALSDAIHALEKKKPTVPVALPTDESKITYITSQSDLSKISVTDSDSFYVLKNDITLDSSYMCMDQLGGVFDGQGHTITFDNSWELFSGISATGVVQNIYFTGNIDGFQSTGPVGLSVKGSIINCYTDVTGEKTNGFAKRLEGGLLSNCYSVSSGKQGVLFSSYVSGTLQNTYWHEYMINPCDFPAASLINSYASSEDWLKSLDFADFLNKQKGEHGISWGQSSTGYPYFGENQEYIPPEPPQTEYSVIFTPYNGKPVTLDGQTLTISPDATNEFRFAGTLSLNGVPDTSKIQWSCNDVMPEKAIMMGADTGGDISVYSNGTATITATETKEDGSSEIVATITVKSKADTMSELKLAIDGNDVTDKNYTVAGSAWSDIQVLAKYQGSEDFTPVVSSRFTFTADDTDLIYSTTTSNSFYFTSPGTGSITVSSKENPEVSAKVTVTSTYVAVKSIKPAISGIKVLHGRNANSSKGKDFLPDYSSVIITPENASNRDNYIISSSNPKVGAYVPSMVKGYVPYNAGTTTYTATLEDTNPSTGETDIVSGSEEVTYTYLNPLVSVTAETDKVSLKNNTSVHLDLVFTGERSDEGYSVTEPELSWSYDTEGIVKIARITEGSWKRNTDAPDNNQYIAGTDYYIYALSEGTVTATGTPLDSSGNAKPVTVTITVTQGDNPPADVEKLAADGIQSAVDFLIQEQSDTYVYSQEWVVLSFLRSGISLSQEQLDTYYTSVLSIIKDWDAGQKPTDLERVALTFAAMGKDITNIDGINLAAMIYDHPNLDSGSNELIYALLALDAQNTIIPENAKWTRDSIIDALLKYQNEDGGIGLADNSTASVDITAMALQAIAKYEDSNEDVAVFIEKALGYLKKEMTPDSGFGSSESTAQVLLALTALNRNPLTPSNGFGTPYSNLITNLMQYSAEDGSGFCHTTDSEASAMATLQVMQALESYHRYLTSSNSYWDMTDVLPKAPVTTEVPATTPPDGSVTPSTTVAPPAPAATASTNPTVTRKPLVKLNCQKGRLQVGKSTTVLKVSKKMTGDKVVNWKSSKPKIATVSKKGKITGKKPGTAIITVTMKSGATAECKVTVQSKPVKNKIKFKKSLYQLSTGNTVATKFSRNNDFDTIKSFASSNKKIVTVTKSGVIKGMKPGKAKITVKTKSGAKATVTVTVNKNKRI